MLFSEHGNSDPTSEYGEEEDKVKVEEASVNLDCVKRELDEEELEFEHEQDKIALTFENVFGESTTQQRSNQHSLTVFLDRNAIMETGRVKLEDVKEENKALVQKTIEESHCNKCDGNYQGYCLNCSSLSHILNNLTPNLNTEPVLNTTPPNMFEIRKILTRGCAVFALKTLPKGIILGPFEGIAPIESTTGLQWKIKDKKFLNDQNCNWMKYIQSLVNHSSKNLDVFLIDGILYFETSREIHEGEELLVCYCEEEKEDMLKSDKEEVFYLVPVKKDGYRKVYACTHCCLGFRLESCLVEHKSKCPYGGVNIEDFEIMQCRCCRVWLEKEEYLKSHMMHCLENYNRSCRNRNLPEFPPTYTDEEQVHENEEITTSIDDDVNASYSTLLPTEPIDYNNCFSRTDFHDRNMGTVPSNTNEKKEYKCSECTYKTNNKGSLRTHLGTHTKHLQCDICKQRFGRKSSLKLHIKDKHSNTNEKKDYKCSECSYETNLKGSLKTHLGTHTKHLQCAICRQRFGRKHNLKLHIKDKHSNSNEKEYKCSECTYQTNNKGSLKTHFGTHTKHLQCDICKQRFVHKGNLKVHIKDKHSNTNEKEYKCSECTYQTNHKGSLKTHLGTHTKHLQYDIICKQRFGHKSSLNVHIKNQHSNTNEKKEYKCSKCSYQTNLKGSLKTHLGTHTDVKHFQCDICKQRFGQKSHMKLHIKDKHSNTNEKEYKCYECSYQTNLKGSLKTHLRTHNKDLQCDICKKRFALKCHLNVHIKDKHSNRNEKKEYKCSECSYQTNLKSSLKTHLRTHNKDLQCDICNKRFALKCHLKLHIKDKHSNRNEKKEYKCSECAYQTNRKGNLKIHLGTHIKHV